ncbi:MAG: hypothetical protein EPO39_05505 [Candidatus Manganitrophaceae bacterium]|nr:MAG: hypothetical protein EPO39_05505 [Candidatus Manganitrophaceae bacterium]
MATLCIYCGVEPGTTNDHVPAKNLFPKPLPKLITVPSCGTCNQRYKKDEELFRAWILFGSAGVTKHGKLLWDQKLHRGYKKNLGLKKVIARSLRQVDLVTQGGIYIGRRWEISPDAKRIENVLWKIVRGLFWVEYKERLPEDIPTEIIPIHSKRDPRISEAIPRTRQSAAFWEGIFECRYIRSHMNTYESFWLMAFYRQNYFAVKVDFQEHDTEL